MNGFTDQISFHINGKKFIVNPGVGANSHPNSLLVDFIRHEAGLTGTKFMCREAGCGACVVTVKIKDPLTGAPHTSSINSCVTPVLSCDGWDISTVERLGNHKDGYSLIQQRLVGFSGTQCGFCTPGMVMNMHGLLQANPSITAKEIEDSFDGNVCRCTGFRPILDAFKSLAPDASDAIKRKCAEFEKSTGSVCPLKDGCCKAGKCLKSAKGNCVEIEDCCKNSPVNLKMVNGQQWLKPTSLAEGMDILKQFVSGRVKYRIVAGNTSTGIFKFDGPYPAYVDINGIPDLRKYTVDASNLIIGAGVKLTTVTQLLKKASKTSGFEYGEALARHWLRVANVPVRNAGTIAGNLMIKHAHEDFPSDIFLTLEALGAMVNIASVQGSQKLYSIADFLKLNMVGHLIIAIHFPSLPKSGGYHFRSFKITKRYQNAHAYVNGALVFKVDSKFSVTERPRICFGGINPGFVHANGTEAFLTGKSLTDPSVVKAALELVEQELNPDLKPPDASPEYRKSLARNLLYKAILGIIGSKNTAAKLASGGGDIEHKLSSGKQTYETKKEEWPLTQPVTKLEAPAQCSGEAEYVNDIRPQHDELFGAFVLSKVANADLKGFDTSEAMKIPGVVSFVSAKDIPGANNYIYAFGFGTEEIFVSNKIRAAGQPLGLILAETRHAAFEAARKVKVNYGNVKKPVLTIKDGLKLAEKEGTMGQVYLPTAKLERNSSSATAAAPKHQISGEFEISGQYHFQMEPQVALCIPKEGGTMDVYSATQFIDQVQIAIAGMLGINNSQINVQVRRLGGGFGAKGSPATQIAAGCALGAFVTNRPVRVVLDLETNMSMLGKRAPYLCKYDIGFDDNGKIQKLRTFVLSDAGIAPIESDTLFAVTCTQNCYQASDWEVTGGNVFTNKHRSNYCRAPGTTQGIAMIETMMEHIAHYLKKDPLEVRLVNLIKSGDPLLFIPGFGHEMKFEGENFIPRLLSEMKTSADYEERKRDIAAFNKANRWVKKGLSVLPMKYVQHIYMCNMPCYVAIYHADGSVAISHGGIEMGQGINTKAAQTVAHILGIPLDKVKVKPADNLISANGMVTGGAIASELVSWAATKACNILQERLAPIKAKLGQGVSWEKLIAAAQVEGIDLKASYLPTEADGLKPYDIWGLNVTEVEVDILTGEFKVARVDVIEDAGKSMSPEVDVGQVEGSLVMGLGLWTLEKLHYDTETGELLTHNTWEYKPPFAKDAPEDMRVTLLSNAPNPIGVHGSKATGEPPLCMSVGVVFALKQAIDSARQDAGNFDYYRLDTPVTPESVVLHSMTTKQQLTL